MTVRRARFTTTRRRFCGLCATAETMRAWPPWGRHVTRGEGGEQNTSRVLQDAYRRRCGMISQKQANFNHTPYGYTTQKPVTVIQSIEFLRMVLDMRHT